PARAARPTHRRGGAEVQSRADGSGTGAGVWIGQSGGGDDLEDEGERPREFRSKRHHHGAQRPRAGGHARTRDRFRLVNAPGFIARGSTSHVGRAGPVLSRTFNSGESTTDCFGALPTTMSMLIAASRRTGCRIVVSAGRARAAGTMSL